MKLPCLIGLATGLLFVSSLPAADLEKTSAASAGFSEERLERLDKAIESSIAEQKMAGALLYVAKGGKIVRLTPYGKQDIEAGKAMKEDTLFRIASMSKAVTTVAVMMLYEEGRFMLNDPVSKYIPAFANSVVAVPRTADTPAGQSYATVKAKRGITIRDLLTHSAGLTYGDGLASEAYKSAKLSGWYLSGHDETIAQVVDRLATLPLHGQPGETFQYGYSTDVLGRLVEVVSGMPLDQFFAERIFKPLGMADTCFFLPPEKADRLMPVYGYEKGKLSVNETSKTTDFIHGPRKCFSGGAGLISSARDYGVFLQMLLNGGELDGKRLLAPLTVELMHRNHTGERYAWDTRFFGLGFWVNQDPGAYGELVPEGSYGWGSAYYPQYVVDPKNGIVAILMTQLRPAEDFNLNQRYKVLLYQALVK